MDYVVVIEPAEDGSYSAYVPDLPGCVSCGDSLEEVREMIHEAIEAHIQLMREHNEPVPEPRTTTITVQAA